ncbi:hypothetical protein PHYSODRAFT_427048, partial [Phytophthora sojae]
HVVDSSAPASEASAASTPASASASGALRRPQASAAVPVASAPGSGAGSSAGAAPSPTPVSAGARGHSQRRFANFAQLMVGLVRHPPLRVDYELDQRFERAQSLGEVVEALNPDPCGLLMGWDEEMRKLRLEVQYFERRAQHFELLLNQETDLKNQAQILCTRASFERNELFEVVKSLRHERDAVWRQLRKHNTAMATNDETIALLRSQCERYEASLKASDSFLVKDRELFKSGLQEYNRNMRQLRSLLVNQARS